MKILQKSKLTIIILTLLLLLVLTACSKEENISVDTVQEVNSSEESSLEESENRNSGEVKYLLVERITEDLRTGEKYVSLTRDYDNSGNLLEEIQYDKDGEITAYEKYVYEKKGRVKEFTELRYVFGDYITRNYNYDYDGRKTGYIDQTEVGAKCGEGKYEYYDNGDLKYEYSQNIYQDRETEIFYKENGEKEKKRDYSGLLERTYVSDFEQEYNEEGVKVKEIETLLAEETGQKVQNIDYYNKNGQIEKFVKKSGENILIIFEWEYNEKGNMIQFIGNSYGDMKEIEEYIYDEYGRKIKEIHKTNVDSAERIVAWYEWEYDNYGNMIKLISKNSHGEIVIIDIYKYEGRKERWLK